MKRLFYIGCLFFLLQSCGKDDHYSPDINDPSLLPDRGDYLTEDYGTQAYANELAGEYDTHIGMIYYDADTRIIPQLYLTGGPHTLIVDSLMSGAVHIHFEKFSTAFMPLQLSVDIKTLLEVTADTIFLRGTDGVVRTANPEGPIGTPLPESDDAELIGKYIRRTGDLELLIDPMLPVPVKTIINGTKKQ
ncbi:MAG: hypothetical protein ACTHYC_01940 [Sphingobacterium sp.]